MTGVSILGRALSQISLIKEQQTLFADLSTQLATGKKTQSFTGLGNDILTSKRTRADLKSKEQYLDNIKKADTRINLMLQALKEFKQQSRNFADALFGLSQESVHQKGDTVRYDDPLTPEVENTAYGMTSADPDIDFETMQTLARNVEKFMIDLLNTKNGDRYLLAGAETTTQPVGNNGLLDTAVSTLLDGWRAGTITTQELIADFSDREASVGNPNAITDSIVEFAPVLSSGTAGKVFVRVDDISEIEYTALANEQAFRDILVAVSFIANENLGPIGDVYTPPNAPPNPPDIQGAPGATLDEQRESFFEMFNGLTAMVSEAISDMDATIYKLETARARINEIRISHENELTLLKNTIADVENVDINDVALSISTLQVQLDASFRVAAKLQELSLVNFIR